MRNKNDLPVADRQILALLPGPAARWAVGNDLVSLPEFQRTCTPQFLRRAYTAAELAYCRQFADPLLRHASTWAAKEAVYKALKQVDENVRLWWRDIEVVRDKPAGRPMVRIAKLPYALACSLTISHDGELVWAIAVVERT